MVDKSAIAGFINDAYVDKTVATLAAKSELKAEQDKIIKHQEFDSSYFCSKSHFEDDGTQHYLVFQTMYRYLKKLVILIIFQHGNLKDCLMKSIKHRATSNNNISPSLSNIGTKT